MKKIIVVGAIGNTARQNRDDMRVLARGGVCITSKLIYRQISLWWYENGKRIDCNRLTES